MSVTPAHGPLIVVAGPSGVGKSTLVEALLRTTALPVRRAVTATTRPPRPGEKAGVDYHYWTADEFRRAIAAGELLEHAVVHGDHYYGTPWSEVRPHRQTGGAVVLVIDVQGAENVRRLDPGGHRSVFVLPPSDAELEARLRSRGSEDEARVQRRLQTARDELARAGEFDHTIVNGDLAAAVAALEAVIRDELERRRNPEP